MAHKKIILADDDDDDAYFIGKAILEEFPEFEYERANNGRKLISLLQNNSDNIAFVILDLNMPVLDGRETLKHIRVLISTDLPIHVLSNSNHLHEKEYCFAFSIESFLTKPISFEGYQQIIHYYHEVMLNKELAIVERKKLR